VAELISGRFLAYLLMSDAGRSQLSLASYGLKQGLGLDDLKSLMVTIPPIEVQRALVAHLDSEVFRLNSLKREIESAVSILQERRSALISAAVMGKIDTRALQRASLENAA
jgi:type I restriction enzyme S subunit